MASGYPGGGDMLGSLVGVIGGGLVGGTTSALEAQFAASKSTQAWHRYLYERGSRYQVAVEDLRKAGLNPMLAYTQGGAPASYPQVAGTPDIGGDVEKGMQAGGASARAIQRMPSEMDILRAGVRSANADAITAENKAKASEYLKDQAYADVTNAHMSAAAKEQDILLGRAQVNSVNAGTLATHARTGILGVDLELVRSKLASAKAQSEFDATPAGQLLIKMHRGVEAFNPFYDFTTKAAGDIWEGTK